MKSILKRLTAGVLAVALLAGCAAGEEWTRYRISFMDTFDTVVTTIGYTRTGEDFDRYADRAHELLLYYNQLFDRYNSYEGLNNVKTINDNAGIAPVQVDEPLLDLLELCKEWYADSQGTVNVCLGPVLEIWHNYREAALDDPARAAVPSMEELEAAAQHCDINDLILDEEASTVYFADPEMQLDVGSVGKGYAAEMVARAAEERGLKSALISVGGNLRSIGHKPDYSRWTGGIQNPWTTTADIVPTESGGYVAVVEVEDMSLVTSGNYQRYYELDGVRYHHLIDPDTLMPANYYSAVSVLAPDSGLADCLSTGLYCMPLEEGQALVESLENVEAMWMMNEEDEVVYSSGFEAHLKQAS